MDLILKKTMVIGFNENVKIVCQDNDIYHSKKVKILVVNFPSNPFLYIKSYYIKE